jgi:segregation and condensation protein B
MIPGNSGPSDASDRPSDEVRDEPVTMSVDQLTQALAHLMGDERVIVDSSRTVAESSERALDEQDTAAGQAAEPSGADDDENENVTPSSVIEALLFVGHPQNHPLTSRQMASYLRDVTPHEVDGMIEQLNAQYAENQAPFRIVSAGAGYRMLLQPEYAGLSERFYGRVRQAKLSQAAIDLLAIVAYHQPIARDEIDRMRGQASGATLAQLVRRQLLRISYSSDRPRQKIYHTTDRFLDLFRLDSLEDLPSHEDF